MNGATYRLTNLQSGKVLEPNGAAPPTAPAWTSGGARQHLPAVDVHQSGNGNWTITNVNSGTVLDAVNCGIFDGTVTDLW